MNTAAYPMTPMQREKLADVDPIFVAGIYDVVQEWKEFEVMCDLIEIVKKYDCMKSALAMQ